MPENMQSQTSGSSIRILMIILAVSGLLLTLVPSFLNWQGIIGPEHVNKLMVAGTILWFVPAGFLFLKKPSP
jgi:hypothetical protein